MQRWQRDPDGPAQLAVMLNHRYTDAGLDAGSLKGEDRATATALARAAAGAHVDVLLANIEKHEAGQGDYTGGLDTEGDVEVEHTITASVCVSLAPSGLGLVGMPATSAPKLIEEDEFALKGDAFDVEPDKEDIEHTGNAGLCGCMWAYAGRVGFGRVRRGAECS